MKILVVDNDALQRRMYDRVLTKSGHCVATAASAAEALARIPREAPALVLTDVVMPQMDGIAFLRALRAAPATAGLPAILMTGLRVPPALLDAAAESLAPCGFHRKGGDIAELLREVARLADPGYL